MIKPEVYGLSDIQINENGERFLNVRLAQTLINLPIKTVKTNDKELLLAWVDPQRQDLTEAGSIALSELLIDLQPGLIISPFSSKSIPMAAKATQKFNLEMNSQVPFIVLSGGKDIDKIKTEVGSNGWTLSYNPVTSAAEKKYVGISQEHAQLIGHHLSQEHTIAILDDVYGTGATIQAVRDAISMALGIEIPNTKLPALVAAREVEGEYSGQELDHVFASIILPIIVNS